MKVLYCLPSIDTVYSSRFNYEGYKNAFEDLGHEFRPFTSTHSLDALLAEYQPDIFFYSLNFYHLKYVDVQVLKKYRLKGLIVFCQIRAWDYIYPGDNTSSGGLKDNTKELGLIKNNLAGDIYWHWFEQDEPLMKGFKQAGFSFESIHLAANKILYFPDYNKNFEHELSYVGSFLPAKREFFKQHVIPLKKKYDLAIYGADWTVANRLVGKIQKSAQYFNITPLTKLRKIKLPLEDERKLYTSTKINLNVHEEHAKKFNCEMNERVFKIMACGGFELVDNLKLLRKFFTEQELVIAENTEDWFGKINYYMQHPEERKTIAEAGMKKVLRYHTFHTRVEQIKKIVERVQRKKHATTN